MTHPVKGIDHIVILVSDLDASAKHFAALGFTLSPRGTHSPHMGSANYTIILQDDYFELLGMIAETPRNASKRDALAKNGEGLAAIACRIGDAHAARDSLTELGIATSDVMDFSRPLPLPDGSTGTAAFAVTTFEPHEVPRGEMFMCQHKTREMVWRPELMTHANGAIALAGVVVASASPEETARGFARLFAAGHVQGTNNACAVTTGDKSVTITCMTPAAITEYYAGMDAEKILRGDFAALQIAVDDIAKTQAHLQSKSIGFVKGQNRKSVFVFPADAGGTLMEFIQR
ncbi:MAG: VOC family protein [Rhizobiales bacterium]|nr:VOC family protein [Hyphomicrobiales bacterium]